MKKLLLALCLFAAAAIAQPSMVQTTLSSTVDKDQLEVYVASTTGVNVGDWGYADRELFLVASKPTAGTLTVKRGIGGKLTAHTSGVTVYFAAASGFTTQDPAGRCAGAGVPYVPYINYVSGGIFACTSNTWVQTNGGGSATVDAPAINAILAPGDDGAVQPTVSGASVKLPINFSAFLGHLTITDEVWRGAGGVSPAVGAANMGAWFYPATVFAQAGSVTGANITTGTIDFADTGKLYAITDIYLPTGFTSMTWTLRFAVFATSAGNVQWGHAYSCLANAGSLDVAIGSFTPGSAWPTVAVTTLGLAYTASPALTITSSDCPAGSILRFAVFRDNTDSYTEATKMLGVNFQITRTF